MNLQLRLVACRVFCSSDAIVPSHESRRSLMTISCRIRDKEAWFPGQWSWPPRSWFSFSTHSNLMVVKRDQYSQHSEPIMAEVAVVEKKKRKKQKKERNFNKITSNIEWFKADFHYNSHTFRKCTESAGRTCLIGNRACTQPDFINYSFSTMNLV